MVKLEGDDHRFLVTMIDFMYGFDYDTTDHGNTSPIMFHIAAYQIADKYDVPNMKKRAMEKFKGFVTVGWDMDDFPAAVAEVYQTIPICERGIRDPLVRVTHQHFGELLQKESFVKMLEQTPGFAADLARTYFVDGGGGGCPCKVGTNADGWCVSPFMLPLPLICMRSRFWTGANNTTKLHV